MKLAVIQSQIRKTLQINFIFLALSFSFVSAELSAKEITETRFYMKTKVVLETNELKLCDLVRCKGEENLLLASVQEPFYLTPEQAKQYIHAGFSRKGLETAGLSVQGIGAWVIPFTEDVSKESLTKVLLETIKNETETSDEEIRLMLESTSEKFPSSKVKYQFRKIGKEIRPGKRIFPLDFFVNDEKIHSIPLSFLIETKKEAYFTNKEVPAKQILGAEDIQKLSFFDSESGSDYVTESPVGKTALNDLGKGKPLLKKQIRQLNTVERGQEVQLVLALETVLVKVRARALESGNEGSRIRVMNLTSSRILNAEIKGPGICEVKI